MEFKLDVKYNDIPLQSFSSLHFLEKSLSLDLPPSPLQLLSLLFLRQEGGLDRSLSLQRKFFLSPLLSPAAPITLLRVQQDRIAAASGALILTTTLRIVLAGGGRGLQPGDVRELRLPSDAAALQWTQDGEGLLVSHADGQVSMWRRGRGEAETGTPSLGRSFQVGWMNKFKTSDMHA